MNCPHCGSPMLFGGPRCCDRGEAKRKREQTRDEALKARLITIERRLDAIEWMLRTQGGQPP